MAQGVTKPAARQHSHQKEPSANEALEARIAELERFCGQLSLENQILKKSLKKMQSSRGTP
jgi:predicted Ser/Thr protein kinase